MEPIPFHHLTINNFTGNIDRNLPRCYPRDLQECTACKQSVAKIPVFRLILGSMKAADSRFQLGKLLLASCAFPGMSDRYAVVHRRVPHGFWRTCRWIEWISSQEVNPSWVQNHNITFARQRTMRFSAKGKTCWKIAISSGESSSAHLGGRAAPLNLLI